MRRREGREGGKDKRNTIFMGRAKKRIRREIKQGAKKIGTLLYLSSLPYLSVPSVFSK